jgi:hypothetical protein
MARPTSRSELGTDLRNGLLVLRHTLVLVHAHFTLTSFETRLNAGDSERPDPWRRERREPPTCERPSMDAGAGQHRIYGNHRCRVQEIGSRPQCRWENLIGPSGIDANPRSL